MSKPFIAKMALVACTGCIMSTHPTRANPLSARPRSDRDAVTDYGTNLAGSEAFARGDAHISKDPAQQLRFRRVNTASVVESAAAILDAQLGLIGPA